jgi:hypothetical protein
MLTIFEKRTRSYLNNVGIACIFCFWVLLYLTAQLDHEKQVLKQELKKGCVHLEVSINAIGSTPRYVGMSVNRYILKSIRLVEQQMVHSLVFSIEIVKQVLLFVLLKYQKTMQCLVTLSASAGLSSVAAHAQQITDFTNQRLGELQNTLNEGLKGINEQVGNVNGILASIPLVGNNAIPLPIKIPGLEENMKWSLPSDASSTLSQLQSPSLAEIHNNIKSIVSVPFEALKQTVRGQVNITLPDIQMTIPDKVANITFCDQFVPEPAVDFLVDQITKGIHWGMAIVGAVFLISVIFECFRIQFEHQRLEFARQYVEKKLQSDYLTIMSMNTANVSEKVCDRFVYPIISRFMDGSESSQFRYYTEWYLMYVSHDTAWKCIVFGGTGFLLVQLQMWIIERIYAAIVPVVGELMAASVDHVKGIVTKATTDAVGVYVQAMNQELDKVEVLVQEHMGLIISQFTKLINDHVLGIFTAFQETIQDAVKAVPFIGDAISSYFKCMLGDGVLSALEGIQTKVTIPRLEILDFDFDTSKMVDMLDLSSSVTGMYQGSSSTKYEQLFMNQIEAFKEYYIKLIRWQAMPFLVVFCVGCSLLILGMILMLTNILIQKHRTKKEITI